MGSFAASREGLGITSKDAVVVLSLYGGGDVGGPCRGAARDSGRDAGGVPVFPSSGGRVGVALASPDTGRVRVTPPGGGTADMGPNASYLPSADVLAMALRRLRMGDGVWGRCRFGGDAARRCGDEEDEDGDGAQNCPYRAMGEGDGSRRAPRTGDGIRGSGNVSFVCPIAVASLCEAFTASSPLCSDADAHCSREAHSDSTNGLFSLLLDWVLSSPM